MSEQILELATIKLAAEVSEADLLAASDQFQSEFLDQQDGFVRRDMVRTGKGAFLDVILWQTRAHADAVFARAQSSEVAGAYFSKMSFDGVDMDDAVAHYPVLRHFTKAG